MVCGARISNGPWAGSKRQEPLCSPRPVDSGVASPTEKGIAMSLVESSSKPSRRKIDVSTAVRKRKRKGPRPVVGDFAWGAAAIGTVIGCDEKKTFELIYSGVLDGAVKQIKKKDAKHGMYVGYVPKLRALMGGE
jgi:hypothetical protein